MSEPVSCSPIGIFDSGVGGLSVLRHIQIQLPCKDLLYFADSGFAPYGGRPENQILDRTMAVADFLIQQNAKALVIACNTATAIGITALRARYPGLPVVGVEPGLKPGAAQSMAGIVGVLATERTLSSERFANLQERISAATHARFLLQACNGLADQIEKGELASAATMRMVRRYVEPLIGQGADTLVLGCTHYPFVRPLIENVVAGLTSRPVEIIDTGEPVARQLARVLETHPVGMSTRGTVSGFTTGSSTALATAFAKLLGVRVPITPITEQTEITRKA